MSTSAVLLPQFTHPNKHLKVADHDVVERMFGGSTVDFMGIHARLDAQEPEHHQLPRPILGSGGAHVLRYPHSLLRRNLQRMEFVQHLPIRVLSHYSRCCFMRNPPCVVSFPNPWIEFLCVSDLMDVEQTALPFTRR